MDASSFNIERQPLNAVVVVVVDGFVLVAAVELLSSVRGCKRAYCRTTPPACAVNPDKRTD